MPKGELFIKQQGNINPVNGSLSDGWVDAYLQWGMSFSEPALSALMTPAPNKSPIENKSRTRNGKSIIRNGAKKDERDLSLEMHITAPNRTEFWNRYHRFCSEVLDYGYVEVKNAHVPNLVFRLTYNSCTQFSEFSQQMAKFVLRMNEPDPNNRGVTDLWETE